MTRRLQTNEPVEPALSNDQAAALRRLPAAFGFIGALAVVDHKAVEDEGDNEGVEEEDGTTGPPVASEGSRRFPRGVDLTAIQ